MSKKQTVVIDIESYNAIEHPWQQEIGRVLRQNNFAITTAGRGTGKSMYMKVMKNRIYGTNLCEEIMMPMEPKPKYQFSRAKWYKAPRPGHASWNTFSEEYHNILNWCVENYGPHPKRPDAWSRWYMGVGTVNFSNEKDYMLFQLRWA